MQPIQNEPQARMNAYRNQVNQRYSVNTHSLKNPKGRLKTLNQDFQTTFFI
ncbi:hypothetical protein NEISICOT_01631 [Neisseria sicca ATCC 29256]|uniref:Uncharacterized protein n=1 Tax=Neisseria sicca ATCC 29256 TaxID=547045 RepID=C6M532_NEISI|nr:hypothetical protein NEISICOT_01631 [Neisseria sicca ATCC 29256]